MYDSLHELVSKHQREDKYQIESFLSTMKDGYILESLALNTQKIITKKKILDKHRKKKLPTDRWNNKNVELSKEFTYHLTRWMEYLNAAHQQTHFLIRLLYIADNKVGDMYMPLSEADGNFNDMMKSIKFLDSTDRERYRLFNQFRNVVFHTPFEYLIHSMDNNNIEDLKKLFEDLKLTNKMWSDFKAEDLDKIIAQGIKDNFDKAEYEFSDNETSVKFKTNISTKKDMQKK